MKCNGQGVCLQRAWNFSAPPSAVPGHHQQGSRGTRAGPRASWCRSLTTERPGWGTLGWEAGSWAPPPAKAKPSRKEVTIVELLVSLLFHHPKAILTILWCYLCVFPITFFRSSSASCRVPGPVDVWSVNAFQGPPSGSGPSAAQAPVPGQLFG